MEVKMQYTAELKNVLQEVEKLLPESIEWEFEASTAKIFLDKGEAEVALSIIHSIRQSMYHADQRLADCQALLTGYLKAKQPQQNDIDISELQGMIQETEDTLKTLEEGKGNDQVD